MVVLPETHRLAAVQEIRSLDLEGEPMILFPYRLMPGFVARVVMLFDSLPTPPAVVQQAIHQETVLGVVAAGLGISVVPESVRRFQMPGITTRRFVADRRRNFTLRGLAAVLPPWMISSCASGADVRNSACQVMEGNYLKL